ncbi:hypothetical protein OAA59_02670 [bacterium]|nr:hypothetical protein [bacterium]
MKKVAIIAIIVFLSIFFLAPYLFGPTRPPDYESNKSSESNQYGAKAAEESKAEGK